MDAFETHIKNSIETDIAEKWRPENFTEESGTIWNVNSKLMNKDELDAVYPGAEYKKGYVDQWGYGPFVHGVLNLPIPEDLPEDVENVPIAVNASYKYTSNSQKDRDEIRDTLQIVA